jgi:hypothetical protein
MFVTPINLATTDDPMECGGKRSATPLWFLDRKARPAPKRRRRCALPAHSTELLAGRGFMVPEQLFLEQGPFHEPDGRAALLRSRSSIDAAVQAVQQPRPTSDGFMGREHGSRTKGASPEPGSSERESAPVNQSRLTSSAALPLAAFGLEPYPPNSIL